MGDVTSPTSAKRVLVMEGREARDEFCTGLGFRRQVLWHHVVRHRGHGKGVRAGAHQDPACSAADTAEEAADFNTAFLRDISANILEAGKVRRIQPYMAYGPPGPESVAFFRDALPGEVGLSKPGGLISATASMAPSINS